MTRHLILYALIALIVVSVVGAVFYLESTNASSAATTTTSTSTTTTSTTTTTTLPPTTLPPTTLPPPERGTVAVVVSSGSAAGERVAPATFLLSAAGWINIRGLNGPTPSTDSVVYYVDGLQNAAELMAVDLSLPVTATAPIVDAPPVAGLADAQLLVYLGSA